MIKPKHDGCVKLGGVRAVWSDATSGMGAGSGGAALQRGEGQLM